MTSELLLNLIISGVVILVIISASVYMWLQEIKNILDKNNKDRKDE